MEEKVVVYLRVSTKRQEESGLGLEAQRSLVSRYVAHTKSVVLEEFVEAESGKKGDDGRPKLNAALNLVHGSGARLLVAKLDRLARNASFLHRIRESGVKFTCCDMPKANKMTIGIMAEVAEGEGLAISERIRSALAEAKKRGTLLGSAQPDRWVGKEHLREAGRQKATIASAESRRSRTQFRDSTVAGRIIDMRKCRLSYKKIAEVLNAKGYTTQRGNPYGESTVRNIYLRRYKDGSTQEGFLSAAH